MKNIYEIQLTAMCKIFLLALMLLCITVNEKVAASDTKGQIEYYFSGGALSASGGTTAKSASGLSEVTTSIKDGSPFYVGVIFNSYSFYALEIAGGVFTNDYVVDVGGWNPLDDDWRQFSPETTTEELLIHANGIINIMQGSTIPYVTAGIGALAFVDEVSLSPNVGAGVRIYPTEHVGLKIDLRMYWAFLNNSVEWKMITGESQYDLYEYSDTVEYSEELTFTQLTIGVIFRR